MTAPLPIDQHNVEIERNLQSWRRKPVLRRVYRKFHERIARHIDASLSGRIVELGSGIGNIRDVIPGCLRTDLFANPWIDQVENAYSLSFRDGECSHLILFDVFHHLRYPRTALRECRRVLQQGGRVILFEPYISLTGRIVYGPMHHEPIALESEITADAPVLFRVDRDPYYAAQGNATRIFWNGECPEILEGWDVIARERIAAWSYALTGGYSKPQLYPAALYGVMSALDAVMEQVPRVSALRALVVLRRREQ